MARTRYEVPPVLIDPAKRFRQLAPQLMAYPNLPPRAVETILDTLSAIGGGGLHTFGELELSPVGPSGPLMRRR